MVGLSKHDQKLAIMNSFYTTFKEKHPEKKREDFADWLRSQLEEQKMLSIPNNVSQELKQKIMEMYNTTKPHVEVYPPEPETGAILIPTGGLARCECSPNCEKELPMPAYKVLENGVTAGILGYDPSKRSHK